MFKGSNYEIMRTTFRWILAVTLTIAYFLALNDIFAIPAFAPILSDKSGTGLRAFSYSAYFTIAFFVVISYITVYRPGTWYVIPPLILASAGIWVLIIYSGALYSTF